MDYGKGILCLKVFFFGGGGLIEDTTERSMPYKCF